MPCPHNCPVGTCQDFGFTGHRSDLCAGRTTTPEKADAYRKNWFLIKLKGYAQAAVAYTEAYTRWMKAGFPLRTIEEVQRNFSICQSCEEFEASTEGHGKCKLCGCRLAQFSNVTNKIKMKTEDCPLHKWPPPLET